MKKKLMLISCLVSAAAMADTQTTTPDWTVVDNGDGTLTYTATVSGNYNFSLGDAAITDGESFTLSVETTADGWANGWGTGLVGTVDPYNRSWNADNFGVYFGRPTHNTTQLEVDVNLWSYKDGEKFNDISYTKTDIENASSLTLGFTFQFVNSTDAADGNNYIVMGTTQNSDVQFSSVMDDNVVTSYNFAALTNTGAASMTNPVTTIVITKPGSLSVPEPATVTLSLLALAGLVARRRR